MGEFYMSGRLAPAGDNPGIELMGRHSAQLCPPMFLRLVSPYGSMGAYMGAYSYSCSIIDGCTNLYEACFVAEALQQRYKQPCASTGSFPYQRTSQAHTPISIQSIDTFVQHLFSYPHAYMTDTVVCLILVKSLLYYS